MHLTLAFGACTPCGICEREGSLNKTALFVPDKSMCRPLDKVIDLTAFSSVYDLTCCPFAFFNAYYHKLNDCMVPSLPTLHAALMNTDSGSTAVVPNHLAEFYGVLLKTTPSVRLSLYNFRTQACFLVRADQYPVCKVNASVGLSPEVWSAFHRATRAGLEALAQDEKSQMATPGTDTITILQRHGRGRAFANLDDILEAFRSAFPKWRVQVFHGNETVVQTMAAFSQSKVIVGYHGAGLVNALFSPPGAVVLEFTTMRDVNTTALWRSNAGLATIHPKLKWIQHAVDVDRLDNESGTADVVDAVSKIKTHSERDRFIKAVKQIHISRGVLFNSIASLQYQLRTRKHA